ncbi:hypothetical protein CCHR01_12962 [Colletotrichum chrysophilum]|uniref:Uncharacterized protein n=1 Tax=Colletotrichum chrysophilum TaxID=1836956 RepID=A0AAD9EE53_9PEZI|nr:hypothetical protein CCHR01_12962 [Colletotrichum chrysophilum]
MLPCTPANGPKQTVHLLRLHLAWSTSCNHFDVISALLRSDCRLCEPPRMLSLAFAGKADGQGTASQLPDQRSQPAKAEVEDVLLELVTLTSSQSGISGSEADRGIRLLLMSALLLLVSMEPVQGSVSQNMTCLHVARLIRESPILDWPDGQPNNMPEPHRDGRSLSLNQVFHGCPFMSCTIQPIRSRDHFLSTSVHKAAECSEKSGGAPKGRCQVCKSSPDRIPVARDPDRLIAKSPRKLPKKLREQSCEFPALIGRAEGNGGIDENNRLS